ncbi:IS3 family transposase, partial [Mumia zhuanghuii]
MAAVHAARYGVYGARKVWLTLNRERPAEEPPTARCIVERLMGEMNLAGAVRGKVKRTTIGEPKMVKPLDLVAHQDHGVQCMSAAYSCVVPRERAMPGMPPTEDNHRRDRSRPTPHRRTHSDKVGDAIFTVLTRLSLGPAHLLATRGRNAGRLRTNSVIVITHGGHRFLVTPYGHVPWVNDARFQLTWAGELLFFATIAWGTGAA